MYFVERSSFCELATQTVLFTKIKVVLFVGSFFFFSKTPSTKVAKCIFRFLITVILLQTKSIVTCMFPYKIIKIFCVIY